MTYTINKKHRIGQIPLFLLREARLFNVCGTVEQVSQSVVSSVIFNAVVCWRNTRKQLTLTDCGNLTGGMALPREVNCSPSKE